MLNIGEIKTYLPYLLNSKTSVSELNRTNTNQKKKKNSKNTNFWYFKFKNTIFKFFLS